MKILLFADIHIGSIKDINYVYNIIKNIIDKECVYDKCNAVIILGDYFHRLFKANEEYISLAINVMSYIIKTCKMRKIKLRLVYGTESHEMSQYRLFNYHLTDPDLDIKIIDTVTEEELFPNINILYVPEEYIESKEKHYKNYFNKKYNYIFGHGVIIEGMPMVLYNKTNSKEKKVPYFKSKELGNISDLCIFGHYHRYLKLDNVFYLGSLFRDSFGEEDPKGYGIIKDGKFEFIENEEAYIYKTYEFDEKSEIYKDSEKLIQMIKNIKKENEDIFKGEKVGKIRLIFNLEDKDDMFKENIRNLLFNDKLISLLINEKTELIKEIEDEIEEEYDYILDNSLLITDKIHRYLKQEYDSDMSMKELIKYINEEYNIKKEEQA